MGKKAEMHIKTTTNVYDFVCYRLIIKQQQKLQPPATAASAELKSVIGRNPFAI